MTRKRKGEMTHEEIGQFFGITPERVRQIEARALAKAKRILERRGITVADLLRSNGFVFERPYHRPPRAEAGGDQ